MGACGELGKRWRRRWEWTGEWVWWLWWRSLWDLGRLILVHPTCAQCHWSGQGNAWGESFAMKYMQRGLKYCEKGHLNLDLWWKSLGYTRTFQWSWSRYGQNIWTILGASWDPFKFSFEWLSITRCSSNRSWPLLLLGKARKGEQTSCRCEINFVTLHSCIRQFDPVSTLGAAYYNIHITREYNPTDSIAFGAHKIFDFLNNCGIDIQFRGHTIVKNVRAAMTRQHIDTYGLSLSPILANFQKTPNTLFVRHGNEGSVTHAYCGPWQLVFVRASMWMYISSRVSQGGDSQSWTRPTFLFSALTEGTLGWGWRSGRRVEKPAPKFEWLFFLILLT